MVEIIGAVIGIIYLLLEYKANPWLWLFGVLMPLFYIYIFFDQGIYANACINVYYVVISLYGAWCWLRPKKAATEPAPDEGSGIRSMPRRYWIGIVAAVAALTALLSWLLQALGESQTALLDGLTTALSVVAMWMLAKKYYQQWICWIVVEPVMVVMSLRAELYPTAVMYSVYTVIAVLGYRRWKRESVGGMQPKS